MKYDFQTVVNRMDQGAVKWLAMHEEKEDVAENAVPLSVADLDIKMAPGIIEGLKKELDTLILGYNLPTKDYYQAVKDWMQTQHNWSVQEEWLVTAPGIVAAINVFINAFTQKGEGVMIMDPVYHPFSKTINNLERKLELVSLKNNNGCYSIDFDLLEKTAAKESTKALIFCSPHNPVGRLWTEEELRRVAEICITNDVKIFSDEVHFDLIKPGSTHHVMAGLSEEIAQHVITATAPSKTFNIAGLMTSNIFISNPQLREQYIETAERLNLISVPALGLIACQYAYATSADWKDGFVELVYDNYEVVKEMVSEKLPQAVISPLESTYLVWLDLRAYGLSPEEIDEINRQNDVCINNGQMFGESGEGFVRIHIGAPTKVIEETITRLCAGFAPLETHKEE